MLLEDHTAEITHLTVRETHFIYRVRDLITVKFRQAKEQSKLLP